jgi:hypothetical protein
MERNNIKCEQNLSVLIVHADGTKLFLWFKERIDYTGYV